MSRDELCELFRDLIWEFDSMRKELKEDIDHCAMSSRLENLQSLLEDKEYRLFLGEKE